MVPQMIEPAHLRTVVEGTLDVLAEVAHEPRLASPAAVNLLLMTAAHESRCGRYLWQVGGGPAVGIYQHEPATLHDDVEYLGRSRTLENIYGLFRAQGLQSIDGMPADVALRWEVATNLSLATALARVHYWRVPEPLPPATDIRALAWYAKAYWNTWQGKANVVDYEIAYRYFFPRGDDTP
jgi:hypothetical protein